MADVIPIIEENLHLSKRRVETDRVRVRTVVDTREELVADTLQYETLDVERRTVERQVDAPPPPREEGDTTIISLVEERLVVSRALFVVEEVIIRRTAQSERMEVPVTLRTTRAVVDHQPITHQQEE
ncbi:MAG TPA: YsnF/AvaK domain-containing protein [Sphingomonas sp.]